MENRFNLIDQPWIPVADIGRVSLGQLFSNPDYRALGGTPVQKIAVMKLLLAIAQAATTPEDDAAWDALSMQCMVDRCLSYLHRWRDRFYLYGEHPFLQMPAIARAAVRSFGAVLPEVATGNTTVLTQSQVPRRLEDADKALLLLCLMGFALGGKKTDNSVILSPGYAGKTNDKGKASTGKPGPSVGYFGLLHSLILGESLLETLRLNLWTDQDVRNAGYYPNGLGIPPWEQMPQGESCARAQALKGALMGRLLPLSRFCLLHEDGLHYSEGIAHPDYKAGGVDPTVAINHSGKDLKALWVNPEKRPWRELPALLSFLETSQGRFDCQQLRVAQKRVQQSVARFAIWSGGLCVSSNAGEQYVSGSDDFVESVVWLESEMLDSFWFARLRQEMEALSDLGKLLYGCVMGFGKAQLVDGQDMAGHACQLFWQLCEREFQTLIDHCDVSAQAQAVRQQLRRRFGAYVHHAFDQQCAHDTARQLDAWARSRPNLHKYLQQEAS